MQKKNKCTFKLIQILEEKENHRHRPMTSLIPIFNTLYKLCHVTKYVRSRANESEKIHSFIRLGVAAAAAEEKIHLKKNYIDKIKHL